MIEVFKTNVIYKDRAKQILDDIHQDIAHCIANFDLGDCDHILRVKGIREEADIYRIISLVKSHGFEANILPDDFEPFDEKMSMHENAWMND